MGYKKGVMSYIVNIPLITIHTNLAYPMHPLDPSIKNFLEFRNFISEQDMRQLSKRKREIANITQAVADTEIISAIFYNSTAEKTSQ